ncbi:putative signal transducing protein [Aquimarina rhabdastrellae]
MNLFPESDYERVYTGSLINVQFLQNVLQDSGINSLTRDDFESGLRGGFGGGLPNQIQLFVKKTDAENALPIIEKSLAN